MGKKKSLNIMSAVFILVALIMTVWGGIKFHSNYFDNMDVGNFYLMIIFFMVVTVMFVSSIAFFALGMMAKE